MQCCDNHSTHKEEKKEEKHGVHNRPSEGRELRLSKKAALWGLAVVIFVGGIVFLAKDEQKRNAVEARHAASSAALSAEEQKFDFGEISMANGKVSKTFKIKNESGESVTVRKIFTSCMCTTASFISGDQRFGPFGMPGHGSIPKIDEVIAAGEEASLEVVFDPNAHGPAGVGRIERVITVEQANGDTLEFTIQVTVKP